MIGTAMQYTLKTIKLIEGDNDMKKLIVLIIIFFATPAFADYTIDLKNGSGTVLKTYTITVNQVAHMQKVAARTGVSVIKQFEGAVLSIIKSAEATNAAFWKRDNATYIEEQSRQ